MFVQQTVSQLSVLLNYFTMFLYQAIIVKFSVIIIKVKLIIIVTVNVHIILHLLVINILQVLKVSIHVQIGRASCRESV